jgi:hypothetical protein
MARRLKRVTVEKAITKMAQSSMCVCDKKNIKHPIIIALFSVITLYTWLVFLCVYSLFMYSIWPIIVSVLYLYFIEHVFYMDQ